MLPWASFPKRFPTDALHSREVHARTRRGQVLSRACAQGAGTVERSARWRFRVYRGVWSFSRPSSRRLGAALRCDVPLRVALRCTGSRCAEAHPSPEFVQHCLPGAFAGAENATGSAFLADINHQARCGRVQSTVPRRRSASGPDIPLVRDAFGFRDSIGGTAPRIERPLGRTRESAFITVRNASGPASSSSIPAVGSWFSPRDHTWNRAIPRAHSRNVSLGPSSSERRTRLDSHFPLAEAIWPLPPRSSVSRDAEAPWFADSQVGSTSPAGHPSRGNSPWSSVGCTPFESAFFSAPERRESGVFWGTRPLGRLLRGARVSLHAGASWGLRLPVGSALGEGHRRSVETRWFGLSL
jgi:hypothetical protein